MNACVFVTFSATHIPLIWIGLKMSPLVLRLEETFQELEKALNDF